nr:glycine--tRNA ligase subunit beta [Alkalilimnicola ehrlichii]
MTNTPRDLLIELGTEELPPKALRKLSEAFCEEVVKQLQDADIGFTDAKAYASPRRLAILLSKVAEKQPDRALERKGPALNAAYDQEGKPTKAALGFARSCGVELDALSTLETEQGAWLVYRGEQKGQATSALVPEIVAQALSRLPIPKRMRWGRAVRTLFGRCTGLSYCSAKKLSTPSFSA